MSNNTIDNGNNIDSNINNYIAAAPTAPPDGGGPMSMKRERSSIEVNAGDPNNDDASQQSTPASVNGPEPKKRKSAPGSRGVANLTPEQLAKKRANGMVPLLSLGTIHSTHSHPYPHTHTNTANPTHALCCS